MIEVKNLTKRYGNHLAVDHLNFTVESGKIYGFLGPNGAGKSTTMNIMTGYLGATEGQVLIDGHDILKEPEEAKKNIGYLPEIPPLYMEMTVREYLEFAAELKGIKKDKREPQIEEVIRLAKLRDVENRLIQNLSKGYKQRVGLAQAVLGFPEIIILDEPTAGLDVIARDELLDLLRDFMGEDDQRSIIISSHIATDLESLCDDLYLINEGKILLHEDTDVLLSDYALLKMSEEQFAKVDRSYLLRVRREPYGYCALCAQKQYYAENDPQIVIQNSGIDDLITMMIRGEKR